MKSISKSPNLSLNLLLHKSISITPSIWDSETGKSSSSSYRELILSDGLTNSLEYNDLPLFLGILSKIVALYFPEELRGDIKVLQDIFIAEEKKVLLSNSVTNRIFEHLKTFQYFNNFEEDKDFVFQVFSNQCQVFLSKSQVSDYDIYTFVIDNNITLLDSPQGPSVVLETRKDFIDKWERADEIKEDPSQIISETKSETEFMENIQKLEYPDDDDDASSTDKDSPNNTDETEQASFYSYASCPIS